MKCKIKDIMESYVKSCYIGFSDSEQCPGYTWYAWLQRWLVS